MADIRWYAPAQLYDGRTLQTGQALAVEGHTVVARQPASQVAPSALVPVPGLITPGFVDLQVNGGGDVMFNENPTVAGLQTIVNAHRKLGTTGLLPTVITDRPEVLERAVTAVLDAHHIRGILGIHIEGPHIAPSRRGTHAPQFVRPMEAATINHIRRLRQADVNVMITLAPEAASAAQIAELAALGAVVSIGHSDATAAQTQAALAAGARCFTHLFNAMSPMQGREPGVVGAAINSTAYAGIICDGIHVHDSMVGLAIRARPTPERMFLVSDAMATVGGSDHFNLYGNRVTLLDGRLVNQEGGLAGAHVCMAESVDRLINTIGIDPVHALSMAIEIPLRVMSNQAEQPELLIGSKLDDLFVMTDSYKQMTPLTVLSASQQTTPAA